MDREIIKSELTGSVLRNTGLNVTDEQLKTAVRGKLADIYASGNAPMSFADRMLLADEVYAQLRQLRDTLKAAGAQRCGTAPGNLSPIEHLYTRGITIPPEVYMNALSDYGARAGRGNSEDIADFIEDWLCQDNK